MSATRDPSEKVTFLFTPMGKLVQKIRETPLREPAESRARVLKTGDAHEANHRPGLIREYRAREIHPLPPATRPAALPESLVSQLQKCDLRLREQKTALETLNKNLRELETLEKRLQFMLLELEELMKS
ncbi:MAG: hypothetical protein RJB38_2256 [Pseudomonadota bacterium]|jgi:hypothetical protein